MLSLPPEQRKRIDPPLDMWALGIILHIMLVGCHPYDATGEAPDTKIAKMVISMKTPPTLEEGSEMTAHLSPSAIDVIRKLLDPDPEKRITAAEMLKHPWVLGEAARKDKISGSDKKLSKFRQFKSRLEAKVFEDIISWADGDDVDMAAKRTSLIEHSFRQLDEEQKGKAVDTAQIRDRCVIVYRLY
jgi:serine/threonine protein kinase